MRFCFVEQQSSSVEYKVGSDHFSSAFRSDSKDFGLLVNPLNQPLVFVVLLHFLVDMPFLQVFDRTFRDEL